MRIAAGLCTWCSKTCIPGETYCETCRDFHRTKRAEYERGRSQTAERKESQRLQAQKARQGKKAAGLCVGCGNQPIPDQSRCEVCRDKHNESRSRGKEVRPRAPKLTPEERIERRRKYERTRSQTPERKEAARLRAEKQRQERKTAQLAPTQ